MQKAVILDFIGIIADIKFVKLFSYLTIPEKFKALRIYVSMFKHKEIKQAFNKYQTGEYDYYDMYNALELFCPNACCILPRVLEALSNSIVVNEQVLDLVYNLRKSGIKIIVISNSIPETQIAMDRYDLSQVFDGVILSHHLGIKKPSDEIYKYAINEFDLNPNKTLMIDDTKRNLEAAKKFGINTLNLTNTNQVRRFLEQINSKINLCL